MPLKLTKDEMSRLPAWAKKQIAEQSTEKEQKALDITLSVEDDYRQYFEKYYSKDNWKRKIKPLYVKLEKSDIKDYMILIWSCIFKFFIFQVVFIFAMFQRAPIPVIIR